MNHPEDSLETALAWHHAGRGAAVATVIETWGSAPRPVGSHLVVDREGAMEGSVSGGCVEGAVIVEALEILAGGSARVLEFGVADEDAFAVGLACGGTIRIHIEAVGATLSVDHLQALVDARSMRKPIAYTIDTEGENRNVLGNDAFPDRFRTNQSGMDADGMTFVRIYNPPLRMLIVGAVHIAQHLVPMARACGYDPIVIDPRPVFGSKARFEGVALNDDWPDEALDALGLDRRTAVVTLTHDAKLDDPAIAAALRSDVFYLGALGSRRTHAKRVERLVAHGFSQSDIERIHAPVGLAIGAKSPAEIAVSIMAQITERLRTG